MPTSLMVKNVRNSPEGGQNGVADGKRSRKYEQRKVFAFRAEISKT